MVLPVYKGKGDPMECGSNRGIKLLEHAMKALERMFEHRIWQQINIRRRYAVWIYPNCISSTYINLLTPFLL